MYKLDLHTHSVASVDGGLTLRDYQRMFDSGRLDYVAVTDHDTIGHAIDLQRQLGDRIIVGQEITSKDGEIIGLYLTEAIQPGLSAQRTIELIRQQGGLVCVPHPYEHLRKGLHADVLDTLGEWVDMIEIHNGRASLDARPVQAAEWAQHNRVAPVSASDAHGTIGWGKTYSVVTGPPTRKNLVKQLKHAEHVKGSVGPGGRLYPKFNRLRKVFRRGR